MRDFSGGHDGGHDGEIGEELEAHLRMAIEERVARGESREAAETAARRELGNVTHIKEVTREQRRTPAFTIVAVLTLALAIGANSAVFTVVNAVLLRPLPFRDPARLFLVSYLPTDLPFEIPPGLVDDNWLAYRLNAKSFEHVAAYNRMQATLSGAGDATRVNGARVDPDFFAVLGVAPAVGRPFAREEATQGRDRVAILGALWQDRFAGDPRMALGATPGDVMRIVMRRTGALALWGAVAGVAGSLAVTGVLTKSLFDVKPNDPATMVFVVAAILGIALIAGYVPARRASRVEVLTALPRE
jgi:putative ABC transport system permease protein